MAEDSGEGDLEGLVHRFAMLKRASEAALRRGNSTSALRLLNETLGIAPEDAGFARKKARLAVELGKKAADAGDRAAAKSFIEFAETRLKREHLAPSTLEEILKAKRSLGL